MFNDVLKNLMIYPNQEEAVSTTKNQKQQLLRIECLMQTKNGSLEAQYRVGKAIENIYRITRWRGKELQNDDNVWSHSERIEMLTDLQSAFVHYFFPDFDEDVAKTMAQIHDLPEAMHPFWDIPTPIKMLLSTHHKKILAIIEAKCWDLIQHELGHDKNYLEIYEQRRTIESQLIKYNDTIDAYMMSLYEYTSWNIAFAWTVENYKDRLKKFKKDEKFPFIQILIENRHLVDIPTIQDMFDIEDLVSFSMEQKVLPKMWATWKRIYDDRK